MPNKASARKRVRQNDRRRTRNRATRSEMRTALKAVNVAVAEKTVEALPAVLSVAQSQLAKAAKRNVIKKNTLARKTSRLMKAANKAKAAAAAKA